MRIYIQAFQWAGGLKDGATLYSSLPINTLEDFDSAVASHEGKLLLYKTDDGISLTAKMARETLENNLVLHNHGVSTNTKSSVSWRMIFLIFLAVITAVLIASYFPQIFSYIFNLS